MSSPRPSRLLNAARAAVERVVRLATAALALAAATGCVHTYQPLSGLQGPVVVDPTAPNLAGVRVSVRCLPGDLLDGSETRALCDKVVRLFENQGAVASAVVTGGRFRDEPVEGAEPAPADATELVVELRSRKLGGSNPPLSWALCYVTFTLVPAVTETTFAQDVTVRDGTGFLLASASLKGRIVRQFGVGVWAGTALLDLISRDKADDVGGDAGARALSADLYGQLSQLVFNAKMRWEVLQESAPLVTAGGVAGGGPPAPRAPSRAADDAPAAAP